jgi:hypothetical protein
VIQNKIAIVTMKLEVVVVSEVFAGAIGTEFKEIGFG